MPRGDVLNIQIQVLEIGNQVSVNIGMVAVVGGFSDLALTQIFPHGKVVSHLGRMIALFKITVFLNHGVDHSRGFFLCSAT